MKRLTPALRADADAARGHAVAAVSKASRTRALIPVARPYAAPSAAQRGPVGGTSKRALDLTAALIASAALAPVMGLLAVTVAVADGGAPVFTHRRIGWNGREFRCVKFRTMVRDADKRLAELLEDDPEAAKEWAETRKLRKDPRVTRIGAVLRKTSLDELPQLWNVIRGDMSLVGPRPVVDAELDRYGANRSAYVAVRPGLTGIWQIRGRSDSCFRRRVRYDSHYTRTWSLARDVAIIAKTVPAVIAGRGSY